MRLPFRIAARMFNTVGFDVTSAWPYVLLSRKTDSARRQRALEQFLYRTALAKLLKDVRINCVFDVGANLGQYASMLRELGYEGYIISFEPVRELYENLKVLSGSDAKWTVYGCGLGNSDRVQQIYRAESSLFSSFQKPSSYAIQQFGNASAVVGVESAEIRRLDSILKSIELPINKPRFFLKLDTQGYDLQAFEGVGTELDKIVALQSELSCMPIYESMPHMTEALRVYESKGFRSRGFFPVSRDNQTSHVIEYDCLMIRQV